MKMSFKRADNSKSMLKNLQHRRVSDLLGNTIPEEEAALLSNGRLTCLVCKHRPIFDTIGVLSIHRKGKKHILELSEYLAHKQNLAMRVLQRSEVSGKRQQPSTTGNLSLSSSTIPYSSCVKRAKRSQHPAMDRRLVLDVNIDPVKMQGSEESLPSASSEVRRYLKELSRKKPLEKMVEQRRKYQAERVQEAAAVEVNVDTSQSHTSKPQPETPSVPQEISEPIRSGWIRDFHGVWKRDPEAEFDSDEEVDSQ